MPIDLRIDEERLNALPGHKKDAVYGAIRDYQLLRERNPLALYFPHRRQHIFHSFRAPISMFVGGNQSGKTTCGLADDLIQALDREDLPEHLLQYKRYEPPFLCRIMAPTFPVLETTLYEKLKELCPKHVLLGESWAKAYNPVTRSLEFKNGSKFFFQTYMMDVAMMGGASLDRVHYDEEPPELVREECRIRVMARAGDEVFTMTPVQGLTWSYDAIWKRRGEEQGTGVFVTKDLAVVQVDMDDNPTLSEDAKRLALEGLSKEARDARKSGKFVALHGLIYQEFRRERHVIPEMSSVPENATVVVGIDPGIRNAAAVTWLYLGADDEMVMFEEGFFEGMTVRQVANAIHQTNALYGVTPAYYVIDPAARNKEHQTGRSDQMEYADHGIVAIAGQNAVPAGINRIKERFETERLFITANCRVTIEELQKYRWKKPPRSGEDGPQKPVKQDDHLLDALRYAVMSRPYLPSVADMRQESELAQMVREDQERGDQSQAHPNGNIYC